MSVRQRIVVAWVAILANVGIVEAATAHHRSAVGGIVAGLTCVMVGWWL